MSDRQAKPKSASTARNPLLGAWKTPFEVPPFDKIKPAHFRPAIDKAIETHKAEVEKILSNTASPTFGNTIAAMEKAGAMLTRVLRVFYNLTSADTNPELQAIERDIAPILSRHSTEISLDPRFFQRVDTIFQRGLRQKLDAEQRRVLERAHSSLVRAGAQLEPQSKTRMAEINARLATLGTTFAQNVLADEQSYKLVLEGEADLAGLPDFVRAAAKRAGELDTTTWPGPATTPCTVRLDCSLSTETVSPSAPLSVALPRKVSVSPGASNTRVTITVSTVAWARPDKRSRPRCAAPVGISSNASKRPLRAS